MVDYTVSPRPSGGWRALRGDGTRGPCDHPNQRDALASALDLCAASGGGAVSVLGLDRRPLRVETVPADPARSVRTWTAQPPPAAHSHPRSAATRPSHEHDHEEGSG